MTISRLTRITLDVEYNEGEIDGVPIGHPEDWDWQGILICAGIPEASAIVVASEEVASEDFGRPIEENPWHKIY